MINVTSSQLREAANIKDKIDALQAELNSILGGGDIEAPKRQYIRRKRKMSAKARAAISAAMKARWAKAKK